MQQFGNPDAQPVLEQQGCFYRQVPAAHVRGSRSLFPGQGSQYAGMLRELVHDVPAAAATMREIDAVMAAARLSNLCPDGLGEPAAARHRRVGDADRRCCWPI